MNNKPIVSVLIPVYNTELFVGAAIESILNQTYLDFELLIRDDCSTDKTFDIISQYSLKDSRIKVYRNDKNLGLAGNRFELVRSAVGKYIVWQEADDISTPCRLEHHIAFMDKNPEVAICGGYLELFSDRGILGIRKYPTLDVDLRKIIFRYSPIAGLASMIRATCLKELGNYDRNFPLVDDLEMTFRLGSRYKLANLPEVVLRYRVHQNSGTFKKLKKIELETVAIRKKYADDPSYKMTVFDQFYNWLHYVSIFITPPKVKIWLFRKMRDSLPEKPENNVEHYIGGQLT